MFRSTLLAFLLAVCACGGSTPPTETPDDVSPVATFDRVPRSDFNRLAVRLNIPAFWYTDLNEDSAVDPDEVYLLRFYPTAPTWVVNGQFTPEFVAAYEAIVGATNETPADERQRLVFLDLDQGRPTLIATDLREQPLEHRAFAARMLEIATLIDRIYAQQVGLPALEGALPPNDVASASLFRRNWGPGCRGPQTETNEACSAIPGSPDVQVGVYPSALQEAEDFCDAIAARPDGEELLSPFTVVRGEGEDLNAVPYTEAFPEMPQIAAALQEAADAMTDPAETALVAYLRAAAQSFTDNNWEPADEAWAAMNAHNSRWYLRVGPDEVYWDPCSRKAGFHQTLALINRDSLTWQERLTPLQQDMERSIAELAGRPYRARQVSFHLPDFIDIVANVGDDRDAFGATIGQSLPNWGAVADEGRGRTVAMSNLYTDPESDRVAREQARSMLVESAMAYYVDDPEPGLLATILHEATHNLGPSHDYEYRGQTADAAFGGNMASMLEELKAQSGALHLLALLTGRGVIDEEMRRRSIVNSVVWAFGHISRGMYTPSGQPKAYSQLAAIQIGFLMDQGAVTFDPEAMAANGADRGAFNIDFDRFEAAAEELMTLVASIMARNNVDRANEIVAAYVDSDRLPQAMIAERLTRFPKASFVYSVQL